MSSRFLDVCDLAGRAYREAVWAPMLQASSVIADGNANSYNFPPSLNARPTFKHFHEQLCHLFTARIGDKRSSHGKCGGNRSFGHFAFASIQSWKFDDL